MKPEIIGALLFRMLGVLMFLLGAVPLIGTAIAYFSLSIQAQANDVYFVLNQSLLWLASLVVLGCILLLFSKKFGRLLARGLE